ncbi:hypothetical protein B0I33_10184 [Prauserella shujinwangii]|uniref:LysR substrate binding domain-containing protein n=1 Tax=Prauserella shujinwangii TaxID=1453103 RepID=A0A2T0M2E9_9PSEU|nr:hypothetical protein [Prauserella shujinwangii]PRX50933.1 hypothetical protein B0I33_10184 [Prauserella shujinwangii]
MDSYPATPHVVVGTGRIARHFAGRSGLRLLDRPGDPPPIVEILWWHEQREHDEAHRWLRRIVERAARRSDRALELPGPPG